MEQFRDCIERWLRALNARGAAEDVEAACAPDVVVERYGFAEQRDVLVETLQGRSEVADWFALPAEGTVFAVVGDCMCEETGPTPICRVRYRVEVMDFIGGGDWRFRCDELGRLSWLEHRPDELADA